MNLSRTSTLISALGVWLAPPLANIRAAGITTHSETPVEVARQRRYPKCTRVKRAPCEMLLPEQESSDAV